MNHHTRYLTVNQSLAVLYLSFASLSGVTAFTWYEIYAVYSSDDTGSLLARVVMSLPALAGWCVYVCSNARVTNTRWWCWTFRLTGAALLTGTLTGILQGCSMRYLLGDIYRFSIFWLSLQSCLGAGLSLAHHNVRLLQMVFDRFALLAIGDAVVTCWIATLYPHAKVSTTIYLSAWLWALVNLRSQPGKAIPALMLCLWTLMISGKRGPLMVLPPATVVTVAALCYCRELDLAMIGRFAAKFAGYALATAVSVAIAVAAMPDLQKLTESRWESLRQSAETVVDKLLHDGEVDRSYEGRLDEVENITAYFDGSPHLKATGAGFGAEVPIVAYGVNESSPGLMHHAHIAWALYYLRNGALGVLLMLSYFVSSANAIRYARSSHGRYAAFAVGLAALEFMLSFKSNVLIESVPFPMALSCCLAYAPFARRASTIQTTFRGLAMKPQLT